MFPLNTSKAGEKVAVCCLSCDCEQACRLREMGFVEGVLGKVISNQSRMIVQIGESRLAINKDLAKNILVSPEK